MNICLFCFSDKGAQLAEKLCMLLDTGYDRVHTTERLAREHGFVPHERLSADMGALFAENDALIFIGACGIAVREIAPHLKSKTSDPAVIVIDDQGRYVIPILSGHIGGANAFAEKVAGLLGAVPVITTATDAMGRFSCDAWAEENGYVISSMETAKEISSAILQRDIPVCSDGGLPECLPEGLIRGESGDLGIYIGVYERSPFMRTLRLIPRTLVLGIGCRRGTSKESILSAIMTVAEDKGIDPRAFGQIATIDLKRDEEGLTACAKELGAELLFFSAAELDAAEGEFSESAFVRDTVGTGNVCERAAVLAGGKLIVKKTALNGVTAAVAEKARRIEF